MALVRGPFTIKWGSNTIEDVEELSVEHTIDTEDVETVGGRTIELDGAYKVTAVLTLLATDIAALAVLLPQHFVANGGTMSTGETVENAAGAIDVVPNDCDSELVYNDFDIISCGDPGQVARIVNARTKFEGYEVDNKLQKVMVKIIGDAPSDEATMQFFVEGSLNPVS